MAAYRLLDEIGDMPLSMQAKLLRVLQNHEFQRVGSPVVRQSCVRIVAATNRDLAELIGQGKFRQDLYFRLGIDRTESSLSLTRTGAKTCPFCSSISSSNLQGDSTSLSQDLREEPRAC